MKFIPILFSTPMVQAILDGRKTQTRRIIKSPTGTFAICTLKDGSVVDVQKTNEHEQHLGSLNFPYVKGAVLWVRETFTSYDVVGKNGNEKEYEYKADESPIKLKWKPSIFMPKEACRLFLKVKRIRVERLQEISEADAIAEGAKHGRFYGLGQIGGSTREGFFELWETINKKGSVNKNPWVWVIEFEKIEKPENFI